MEVTGKNMNMGRIICLGAAIMLGSVGIAQAQPGTGSWMHGQQHSFEDLDADGDGRITRDEAAALRAGRFAAMDTDGDGFLSEAELTAQMKARIAHRVARMIARHDVDGDGLLSQAELESRPKRDHFARMDADGDGVVTAEEFETFKPRRGRGDGDCDGRRHGKRDGKPAAN